MVGFSGLICISLHIRRILRRRLIYLFISHKVNRKRETFFLETFLSAQISDSVRVVTNVTLQVRFGPVERSKDELAVIRSPIVLRVKRSVLRLGYLRTSACTCSLSGYALVFH